MLDRLNGWQRLWVVATAVWLSLFALILALDPRAVSWLFAALAFGPPIVVYAIGAGIGWALSGFREK